jgi:glycosyltransferase involved in cell wall biosynthesis
MIKNNPLVSVIVMAYNSSGYILSTLESIYNQTYENVELIVTDDSSEDHTVELVQDWAEKHKQRFKRVEVISWPVNTGIPANCNRGIKKSNGEWLKIIAGDDILLEICLSTFISEIVKDPELRFIASDMHYINAEGELVENKDFRFNAIRGYFFSLKPEEQLKLYARLPVFLNSPSFFMYKPTLQSVDYFDEEFRIYDDLPLIFKILEKGIRIAYIDKKTVKYRIYENSLSRTSNKKTSDIRIMEQRGCFKKYRIKYLRNLNLIDLTVRYDFWLDHSYRGVFGIKALPLMHLINFYQNYMDYLATLYNKSENYSMI